MKVHRRAAIGAALTGIFCGAASRAGETQIPAWVAGPLIRRKASLMRSVRFSANGDELLTLADCTLNLGETLWLDHRKPATGEVAKTHADPKGIASWTFSQTADAKTVAFGISADDEKGKLEGRLLLWSRDSDTPRVVARQPGFLRFVAMNDTGSLAVVAYEKEENQKVHVKVQVWDLVVGKLRRTLLDSNDLLTALALTRDGNKAAIGAWASDEGQMRNQVIVWDSETGEVTRRFVGEDAAFGNSIQFLPDGKTLAIAGTRGAAEKPSGIVQIWDVATGKSVKSFAGLKSPASSIAFSSDGSLLAATASALPSEVPEVQIGGLAIWDAKSGTVLKSEEETGFVMTSAAFAPDGKRLAVTGYATVLATPGDGLLRLYSLK